MARGKYGETYPSKGADRRDPLGAEAAADHAESDGPLLGRVYDPGVEENLEFIRSMTSEHAKRYMGEWIAVAGGGIVAHGKDPRQVHRTGGSVGKGSPFMYYIYARPEEVPFLYVPDE